MELYKYVAICVFCNIIYGSTTNSIEFRSSNNCVCASSLYNTTECQCRDKKTSKIVITVETENDGVKIHCIEKLNWHNQDLPLLKIQKVDYMRFRQCPFPTNFTELISKLKVNNTKELRFDFSKNSPSITLTADYFKGVHNMEKLILNSSDIKDIDENAFQSLDKIVELSLDYNKIQLKDNIFKNLVKLELLALTNNEISIIPENIFKDTKILQTLYLNCNKISHLPDYVFSSLTELKILNLESNLLTNISSIPFKNLKNLEKLNLKNNKIKSIDIDSFEMVYNLKEIILANNYFDLPKSGNIFGNNHELEKIDLSHNSITKMNSFQGITVLRDLDLSYNHISYLNFRDVFTASFTININLNHNKITTADFTEAEEMESRLDANTQKIILSFNGNPMNCNCHVYDFVQYIDRSLDALVTIKADNLNCSSPNNFDNFPVTKLKLNMLTCSLQELKIQDRLTDKCSYGFRPWNKSLIVNCTNSNLTRVPKLLLPTQNIFHQFNQIEVYLDENHLTSGPKENMGYENVTKLVLSSNNINGVTWIPPNLKVLQLHNNNISYLNPEVLTSLISLPLTNITLNNNPWNCDCSAEQLITFLRLSSARKQIDANSITCKGSEKPLIYFDDICPSNIASVLSLCITFSLLTLLIVVLVAFYYRFQQEVKVWLFAHNMCLWFVTEDEIDKDKLYDAFVSYSYQDEDFVVKELLPVLEQGPQPYKICVHIRDWVVGEFISKQIATSVSASRRTIVILSRSFLDSEWGKMEFRTAHEQAIDEGRARVILVLYGNIDVSSDLDDELKAYIRTNTYVKWGDPWFWNKLRYALPHSRIKVKKAQKYQNIMVPMIDKVDNKYVLISDTSSTPYSGTDPLADHLLLNNNKFNPSSGQTFTPPAEFRF